ncbi:5-oxoprolinase subunit PxpA [Microbacterium sp. NPDC096154]|uniref:LamB/YcsF family protein n=1 Tax=Microbacterium sp. NPDC096154 TaxID=3155549 RepID=UPI00332A011D
MEINADAGESFGRWSLGDDEALFRHIDAVNIACGFHGGDPTTMRRTVDLALEYDLSIGAHPGYQDLLGFGRRIIPMPHDQVVDLILYQVGALEAIVRSRGGVLRHIKPHGSLYGVIARDAELGEAVGRALAAVYPNAPVYLAPSVGADAMEAVGCRVVRENAVDLEFDDEAMNIIDPVPREKDPAIVAAQALRIAEGSVLSRTGNIVPMEIASMCVHGDRSNAPQIAAAVRAALTDAGVHVGPLHR